MRRKSRARSKTDPSFMLSYFPSILDTTGELCRIVQRSLRLYKACSTFLFLSLKISSVLKTWAVWEVWADVYPWPRSSCSATKLWSFSIFNFYILFFLSSEQENLSLNQYIHESQVIATDLLFIADNKLSCLQLVFLLPSPCQPWHRLTELLNSKASV